MKRVLSMVLVLCMMLTLIPSILQPMEASAADAVSDPAVFIKQTPKRCTLASAVMMLRRRAYLEGNGNWSSITEESTKSVAWSGGLKWNFTYAGMTVTSSTFSGTAAQKKQKLISLLNSHPEGVVIYMYGDEKKTHAVLATDYDSASGTVYCADPANGLPHGRIPLMSAYLTGSTQDARIGNLQMYWYIQSGNCNISTPIVQPSVHTHSYNYSNDAAHPHSEFKLCSCGDKEYTGKNLLFTSCKQCYPVGNVILTREVEKTKGKVTFHRNAVSNATQYTLKVYRNGSLYGTYTMSSSTYTVSGLSSGEYYGVLYAKNTGTGEERSGSCSSVRILDTYTVSFNANGGTGAPSSQTKIEGTALTLTTAKPTKEGHIFKGWASSKNALEAQYQPGGSYTKNAKITLYAIWEPEIYTVTYDVNGGIGSVASELVTYGNTIKMPNSIVKEYAYLKGWSTNKNATEPEYDLGIDYKIKKNLTLYAVWGEATWGGEVSKSLSGQGTKSNPYQISTAADLAYLANKVNTQTATPKYEYYQLTDNINMTYTEWLPIGVYSNTNQYFYGSFDGNGYTISDLYITQPNQNYVGLFGYAKDSEIKNLTITGAIEGVTSAGTLYIGGVVGYGKNTTFDSINIKYFNVGSIAGGTSEISSVGTMLGKTSGGSITHCEVYDSVLSLKSGYFAAGMMVGICDSNITDCRVESTEDGLFTTAATVGMFTMGGLCGTLSETAEKCSVKAPYFANNIKTTDTTKVGGLVGELSGEAKICLVQFTDAEKNSMTITGMGSQYLGGFVGRAAATAKIRDCKFDGKTISGTTTSGNAYVGGLAGYATAKTNPTVSVSGGQSLSRDALPQKDGYIATWYTDAERTIPYDFSQTVTSDMTLYAKWEKGNNVSDIWDGTSKEPAYNPETKTYTITNGEELAWVADVLNSVITRGTNFPVDISFDGYTIELANDICLNDISNYENWDTASPANGWRQMNYDTNDFAGVFDGNNYHIIGMYANSVCNSLFFSSSGIIKNLGLKNGKGNIASQNKGTISECHNESNWKEDMSISGIANTNSGRITKCYNAGNLTATVFQYPASGIVIHNYGAIEYCYNLGDIVAPGHAGGIVGDTDEGTIKYCYNSGNIVAFNASGITRGYDGTTSYCYNTGNITSTAEDKEGGGEACGIGKSKINQYCYNTGRIIGRGWLAAGISSSSQCSVLNCYNQGDVIGWYAGGIVARHWVYSESHQYPIQYCYNTGSVSSTQTYGGSIVGSASYSIIKNCYSNKTTLFGSKTAVDMTNVEYKSSSQLKTLSSLTGFSTSIWATDPNINDGYPYLVDLKESYKTYTITPVLDGDNSSINRAFVNVEGDLVGSASLTGSVGGAIGYGYGSLSQAVSDNRNMVAMADSVSSITSGSSYKGYAGNIIGYNNSGKFTFDNAYYNNEMNVGSSTNTYDSTAGTARSKKTMNVSFYTNLLGLTPYTSLANLEVDEKAVWVLKNAEFPELYYNCLHDITISEDIENGGVSVDKTQAVDGETVTVTATPARGYVLNKIYVNGEEIDGTTFLMEGASEVYAIFSEEMAQYDVTLTANENATATLVNADSTQNLRLGNSNSLVAKDGEEIQVSATADSDYTVDAIFVNGEEIAGESFILEKDTQVKLAVTSISTEVNAVTNNATNIGSYFAVVSGSVSDAEGDVVRYIRYWKAGDAGTVYTTEVQEGAGAYTAEIFDLEPETTYYYQMTEYGAIKSFTTMVDADENAEGGDNGSGTVPDQPVAVTGVTLNLTNVSLKVGETETLIATVLPTDADNKAVTWKSSNSGVATVTNGTVKGVGTGTATITVTTADGGKTATCTVTVTLPALTETVVSVGNSEYAFFINCQQALSEEYLCVGLYDARGRLLDLSVVEVTGASLYTTSLAKNSSAKYAKVFLWDTLTGMAPLAGVEKVNL